MFSSTAIVIVNKFNNAETDAVILNVLAGKLPNRTVLNTEFAESNGFELGKRYLVTCTEGERHPQFGRQFSFLNGGEVSTMDTLQAIPILGAAEVFKVGKPVEASIEESISEDEGNL